MWFDWFDRDGFVWQKSLFRDLRRRAVLPRLTLPCGRFLVDTLNAGFAFPLLSLPLTLLGVMALASMLRGQDGRKLETSDFTTGLTLGLRRV